MAQIQFIKGINENVIPEIQLTRSRDGSTGTATFRFNNPDILTSNMQTQGDITGVYLQDEEGELILVEPGEDHENLEYLLELLKRSDNKINREEIKEFRTALKEY